MKAGKVVLALDGMGGDRAPDVVVNGADIARERYPDTSYLLFGDPEKLKPLIDKRKGLAQAVEIVPAADAVSADDKPSFALRRRRQSSMWLACQAAAEGRADTVVSAGNTGALMAISMFAMRMLDGAHRPALASFLPTTRGETVMLDLGANLECDADNLAEFAVMGSVFAQVLLGLDAPRVGLLNVGSEELKGHEELRQAAAWLRRPGGPVNFHGFVEGNDIGSGVVDVVVTDGFTGNVALKSIEGTAKLYSGWVRDVFRTSTFAKIGYLFSAGAWRKLQQAGRSATLQRRRLPRARRRVREKPRRHRRSGIRLCHRRGARHGALRIQEQARRRPGQLHQVISTPDAPEEAVQASGGTA